jgi:hypothetical protein
MCPHRELGRQLGTLAEDDMGADEVIEGWHPEDVRQVLEAVKMAADGLITESEMLAKLKDASGVEAFEQHVG